MRNKLDVLCVGSVIPGGDIRQPRGYGRVILGSLAALYERGHRVEYLQLGGTDSPRRDKCSLVIDHNRIDIDVIRLPVEDTQSQKNNFLWYASPGRAKYFADMVVSHLRSTPDIVMSEANAQFYFGTIIAQRMKADNILRVHSIRGIYLRHILQSSYNAPTTSAIKQALECPVSIAHTSILAHRSSYAITLTAIEETALRRTLVSNVSTVQPTYVQFIEEADASPFNSMEPYVMIMQGDPRMILNRMTRDIPVVIIGENTAKLKEYVSLSVKDNVTLAGKINNEQLASIIKGATIIASPRVYTSGVGIGIVEALAYGKAMVTTSVAASKLAGLENGKHLIVEDDFAKWPSIISQLMENKSRRDALETNARKYFNEFLRPDVHSRFLENIMLKVHTR